MAEKALITRADDLGSSHSANEAIYEVSQKGIVKNVSVMACAPYLEEAAEMLASSKDVTFGMHGVINSEWDRVTWGPVAPEEKVPSLIDRRGVFYQDVLELAASRPNLDEIITEYQYQLERLRKAGFPIAYVDSHMMPEGDIPGLAERFDRWAESEGLLNHRYYNRMLKEGGRVSHDRSIFEQAIAQMDGQCKLVLHPAKKSEEMLLTGNRNYSGEYIAWEREDDYRFYGDESVLAFLNRQGVRLLRYTEAQPEKEPYSFSLWAKGKEQL